MKKHVRLNITVPIDLKARMDECGRKINWSAVATKAFEKRLGQRRPEGEWITLHDATLFCSRCGVSHSLVGMEGSYLLTIIQAFYHAHRSCLPKP